MTAVEVCAICDIAGCHHIRDRKSDEELKGALPDVPSASEIITAMLECEARLRAQLAEARAERDRRVEMHECAMAERDDATPYSDEQKSRADRAEAALAAQTEEAVSAVERFLPHIFHEDEWAMSELIAAIRNQPRDRSALDRMLSEAREKALREAVDVYRNMEVMGEDGYPAWDYFLSAEHAILALIEKGKALGLRA